jgi:hypothetical protein
VRFSSPATLKFQTSGLPQLLLLLLVELVAADNIQTLALPQFHATSD